MNRTIRWIGLGVLMLFAVILIFKNIFVSNSDVEDHFAIHILSVEKQAEGSMYVTVEIVNEGGYTLEDNKIFIENADETGTQMNSNTTGENRLSITSSINDKPKNIDVKELNGSFQAIDPGAKVRVGFSISSEQKHNNLLLIMQSAAVQDGNKIKYITRTQDIPIRVA